MTLVSSWLTYRDFQREHRERGRLVTQGYGKYTVFDFLLSIQSS